MATYVTQYKFAQICGISKQAVHQALGEGRIVKTARGIDPENPNNVYFRDLALARQMERATKKKPGLKTESKVKVSLPPEEPPRRPPGRPPNKSQKIPTDTDTDTDDEKVTFDIFQKVYEETRLKKIQADTAVLKYAEIAGAVIDYESLKRKMGVFVDFLLTELVYMPDDISDMIWMQAKSADDPERVIRSMLAKRIEVVVKKAKEAAGRVEPPDKGVKYIMLGMDDDDIQQ